ncbi:MAG: DUF1223 domain-containing protein [Betaproteobacteria bacterium]
MRKTIAVSLVSAVSLIAGNVSAAGCSGPQRVSSGPATVTVAELYTSEGCDSCPPADKWFSSLNVKRDGVVPLAFHVDYWDYIGWKDRFANTAFGARQREAVRRQGGRTAYTPQVMFNGQDHRSWSDQPRFTSSLQAIAARPPRANLALEFTAVAAGLDIALTATLAQVADRADAVVFVAITENNLSNRVTAGENRGVTLKHDHVVRALYGPLGGDASGRAEGKLIVKRPIMLARDWKRGDLSLVTFVQNLRSGEIYQSLSTPLCANL